MNAMNKGLMDDMTADERAVIEGRTTAAPEPDGDDDAALHEVAERTTAEALAEGDEQPAAPAAEAKPEAAAEANPEPEPKPKAEPEAPAMPQYDVASTDFEAQRAAIKAERREVETKWGAGELSDDERVAALETLQDKADALLIEQTRNATLAEANAQHERRAAEAKQLAENTAMAALARTEAAALAAGKPGVDYVKDTLAQSQFDMMFSAVKANPQMAGKAPAELVAEAHRAVRALRGLGAEAAAAPAPGPAAPAPRAKPPIPQTLGNMPSAAAQPVGVDLAEQLAAIDDPDVMEARWAQLPAAQRQQMLRASMPARR